MSLKLWTKRHATRTEAVKGGWGARPTGGTRSEGTDPFENEERNSYGAQKGRKSRKVERDRSSRNYKNGGKKMICIDKKPMTGSVALSGT